MNDWITFNDDGLLEYTARELEVTEKGNIKSTTTNVITAIVNQDLCKAKGIIDGYIFFDTCSRTIRFYGKLKGDNSDTLEIRKWSDFMSNILGAEIEREFGIKYSKNKMEDAITFIANKRQVNLPKMYMESLEYDGEDYISKLLPKYLGADDTPLNAWIMKHILVGMVKRVFVAGSKIGRAHV